MKQFCNREWGENRWQRSYYDRVLRSWEEYLDCWEYMDGNPAKWMEDTLYTEDTTEDL